MVISTWRFPEATKAAWDRLQENGATAIDAVEAGCTFCEQTPCASSVGFGGSPDENGETTLDAMIMDGQTLNVGAVGALRRVKNAIGVARAVLEHTHHSFLVGELATDFATQMGFTEESLSTSASTSSWNQWLENNCQPNFWTDVTPDPSSSCGPYSPTDENRHGERQSGRYESHDTIGMIALDNTGQIAAGTSTNGARHKIPGRVGDSPIVGAGAYANSNIGGAVSTGDGDVMMRLLPAFAAVEGMKSGLSPGPAAQEAVDSITAYYPEFSGAVLALNYNGDFGAACHGMETFPFSLATNETNGEEVIILVNC